MALAADPSSRPPRRARSTCISTSPTCAPRAPARRRVGQRSVRDVVGRGPPSAALDPRRSPAAVIRSRPNTPKTPDAFVLASRHAAAARHRPLRRSSSQVWLREAIKRWSRFRLSSGYSFNTIESRRPILGPVLVVPRRASRSRPASTASPATFSTTSSPGCRRAVAWSTNTRHHTLTFVKVLPRLGPPTWHSARPRRRRRHL